MKSFIKLFSISLSFLLFSFTTDKGSVVTTSFKVWGNCEMCKENIESAVDIKGVKNANWDMDAGRLTVTYDTMKVKEIELHQRIAAAGYDTEKVRATDSAYNKLHKCCRYTRSKELEL